MRTCSKLKSWVITSVKIKKSDRLFVNLLVNPHVESIYGELHEAKKRSFSKFYADAETLEDKIAVLARYILPLDRKLNLIDLKLTEIQEQSHPLKTPLVLLLWATFFPLYITTSDMVWLILIFCTSAVYLLYTLFEMWKARKVVQQALDRLLEKLDNLER